MKTLSNLLYAPKKYMQPKLNEINEDIELDNFQKTIYLPNSKV